MNETLFICWLVSHASVYPGTWTSSGREGEGMESEQQAYLDKLIQSLTPCRRCAVGFC